MRQRLARVILVVFLAASASMAHGDARVGESVHTIHLEDPLANQLGYLLYVPPSYKTDGTKVWPLIVVLHGSVRRGNDPSLLEDLPVLAFADRQEDFPFLVVMPQCPPNVYWQPRFVKSVLDSVEADLRVDRDRVYLTGFSMGGYGTWQTAAAFPGTFAAIAPICGLSDTVDVPRLRGIPIWAFHGADDRNVPAAESVKMIAALRSSGIDARLTVYAGLAHDVWTVTYRDSRLYLWFLEHSLAHRSPTTEATGPY